MRYRLTLFLSLFVTAFYALGASNSSQPCSTFLRELGEWGILLDHTMEVLPGPEAVRSYNLNPRLMYLPSMPQVGFRISEENVHAVAQLLAIDHPADYIERGLRRNLAMGVTEPPLLPYLPKRVQDDLGQPTSESCHRIAYNFNEPFETLDTDLNASGTLDPIYRRYSTLGFGDRLRYGDILSFRTLPNERAPSFTIHSAVYIGGDIVYHKYGPNPLFVAEFTTLDGLFAIYRNSTLGNIQRQIDPTGNRFLHGEPFVIEFLRYDPEKKLPPAKRHPKNTK